MIKQFIIAATSISCILSIASISDAKIAKVNRSVDLEKSCQKPFYSNAQYTRLTKSYPDLSKDLKDICQLIENHYILKSQSTIVYEKEINHKNSDELGGISEVKSIQLLEYFQEKNNLENINADTDIKLIERSYKWDSNSWYLVEAKDVKYHFSFLKRNGKWMIRGYNPVIKLDKL